MPTALELPREEWRRYIEAASKRPDLPEPSAKEIKERELLIARVQEAANELKKLYSVRRVILFGSLAHRAWFSSDSDVDLAVEGLEGASYLKAWGVVEDIIGTRSVDLIDMETASDSLKDTINRHGKEL